MNNLKESNEWKTQLSFNTIKTGVGGVSLSYPMVFSKNVLSRDKLKPQFLWLLTLS